MDTSRPAHFGVKFYCYREVVLSSLSNKIVSEIVLYREVKKYIVFLFRVSPSREVSLYYSTPNVFTLLTSYTSQVGLAVGDIQKERDKAVLTKFHLQVHQ